MLDKKRYTGTLDWMDGKKIDKIFTRGVETVKKNTIEYTRRRLNELIDMLTRKGKTEFGAEAGIHKTVPASDAHHRLGVRKTAG